MSQNVERRSRLDGILETLLQPQGPMANLEGIGRRAADPDNLPAVPRLIPGNPPLQPAPAMPNGMISEMYDAAAGSPPMMPPGTMNVTPSPAARVDGMMERLAPRIGGGAGGDVRGMAANDMLSATPAARADAGGARPMPQASPFGIRPPQDQVDAARAYLVQTATPGSTMQRQTTEVAIGRLHPAFAVKLADTVQAARAAGLTEAGVKSAYRPPGFGVSGYGKGTENAYKSLHSYGIGVDVAGIGNPGSATARQFQEIAEANGVYNPYGYKNGKEWNHFQAVEVKGGSAFESAYPGAYAALRASITKNGPDDLETMWSAVDDVTVPTEAALAALGYTGENAVRDFQTDHPEAGGVDGVAGPNTRTAALTALKAAGSEAPGLAQDALVAAAEAPVDYDSTVLPPDVAPMSFAPRIGGQQGSQTGDRTMSQTAPRFNGQVGDRTMDQPPLRPDGTPYEQPPGTVPAGDRPPPTPRLRPSPPASVIDRLMTRNELGGTPPVNVSPEEEAARAGRRVANDGWALPNEMTAASIEASARGEQAPIPRGQQQAEANVPAPRLRPTPPTEPAPTAEPNRRTIARGDKGEEVRALQKSIAAGMPGLPTDFVDGEYGPYTEGVVMALQERAARTNPEMMVDGIVGDQTWPLIDAVATSVPTPRTRDSAFNSADNILAGTDRTGTAVRGAVGGTDVLGGYRGNSAVPRLATGLDALASGQRAIADANFYKPQNIMRTNAPPAIDGGTDVLSGFRGNSLVPRLTSGRTGPPITITSSAPTVAALPRNMNGAAYPRGGFDSIHSAVFGDQPTLFTDIGAASPPVTQGRSPPRLSYDAMPQTDSLADRMGDAFKPVAPASTTAPPPAPRLTPAGTPVATTPGTPGAPPPAAGGGVAGVYSGGGPTGSPAVASSGTGPGYGGSPSSGTGPGATASTGSGGGATPPSYYDSSRGSVQTWNSSTQSYQSTGYGA